MERRRTKPRPDWQQKVESHGLSFHSTEAGPYWDESAYYAFTESEVAVLEQATYALDGLCLQAVEHLLTERPDLLVERFLIPEPFVDLCRRSWDRDEVTVYGRFDLSFDGRNPPKMLEYNADTPTSLLESAVVQWFWMKECHPRLDQFNSLHERLIEAWKRWAAESGVGKEAVSFLSVSTSDEDAQTTAYMRDVATQAGLRCVQGDVSELGWNAPQRRFVDAREYPVRACFKLYPWEWMIREPFAAHLGESFDDTLWLEPMWKMVLSNKAILPVLWDLFPGHENLLPAAFERLGWDCVRKPVFGREGKGVTVLAADDPEPPYVPYVPYDRFAGPPVYQQLCPLPSFDGNRPVVGSWMVNGNACGVGIREDRSPVTGNTSRFVPHVIV
ncbi:MAG TPA: glutathionylspermidine synthase family protein [Humisphaera sp.]